MNILRVLALTGIAAITLVPAALAQGPGPPPSPDPMGHTRHMERFRGGRDMMMRELDLTKEQRDKIADLRDRQQRRAIDLRAQIQTAQLDMRKLMRADKPEKAAIEKQVDKLSRLRADLQKSQIGTMLEVRDVLTPEQREKMRGRMGEGGPGAGEDEGHEH